MYISKVDIYNYRLLNKTRISCEKDLSLIIGKNNCGKTSFLSILSKCIGSKNDDLTNISKLMLDLDPKNNTVILRFEYVLKNNIPKLKEDFTKFETKK